MRAGFIGWLLAVLCVQTLSAEVFAKAYWMPQGRDSVVGKLGGIDAVSKDTMVDVARRFNLGFEEMRLANPTVDPWVPGDGDLVVLPSLFVLPDAPREGVVLNVAEMRIYYYPRASRNQRPRVLTHPVSIGRQDWKTPLGTTRITAKTRDPAWYPPASVIAEHAANGDALPSRVPPGPDNPLGRHALRLAMPGYLIHGTNRPRGIGMRVSHGCVRMYPEDISTMFDQLPVGTPVHIVDQPVKVGWRQGRMYVEVHPTSGEFDGGGELDFDVVVAIVQSQLTQAEAAHVDWERVRAAVQGMTGIPYEVTRVSRLGN